MTKANLALQQASQLRLDKRAWEETMRKLDIENVALPKPSHGLLWWIKLCPLCQARVNNISPKHPIWYAYGGELGDSGYFTYDHYKCLAPDCGYEKAIYRNLWWKIRI